MGHLLARAALAGAGSADYHRMAGREDGFAGPRAASSRPFWFALIAGIVFSSSTAATAQVPPQRVAMPAFFPLSTKTNGTYDWLRILQAGSTVKIVVADISAVAGGGVTDGGPCLTGPAALFDCLHTAGILVLGYVPTGAGQRDLDNSEPDPTIGQCTCTDPGHRCVLHGGDPAGLDATAQPQPCKYPGAATVDAWYQTYCPNAAACHIDGIFFDTGPNLDSHIPELATSCPAGQTCTIPWNQGQQAYYRSLYQAVTSRVTEPLGGRGCPSPDGASNHQCVMVNAAQFKNNWVISPPTSPLSSTAAIADYVILWERALHGSDMVSTASSQRCEQIGTTDTQEYLSKFCPSPTAQNPQNCGSTQLPERWYFDSSNTGRIAHVIFSVHDATDITRIITQSRNAYGSPGFLYVHDEDCDAAHGAVYHRLPSYFEQLVSALGPSLDFVIPVTNSSTGVTVWVPLSL